MADQPDPQPGQSPTGQQKKAAPSSGGGSKSNQDRPGDFESQMKMTQKMLHAARQHGTLEQQHYLEKQYYHLQRLAAEQGGNQGEVNQIYRKQGKSEAPNVMENKLPGPMREPQAVQKFFGSDKVPTQQGMGGQMETAKQSLMSPAGMIGGAAGGGQAVSPLIAALGQRLGPQGAQLLQRIMGAGQDMGESPMGTKVSAKVNPQGQGQMGGAQRGQLGAPRKALSGGKPEPRVEAKSEQGPAPNKNVTPKKKPPARGPRSPHAKAAPQEDKTKKGKKTVSSSPKIAAKKAEVKAEKAKTTANEGVRNSKYKSSSKKNDAPPPKRRTRKKKTSADS